MPHPSFLRLLAICLSLFSASCSHYSTATQKRPSHVSATAAGQDIKQALRKPASKPEEKIGLYLDAVSSATDVLARNPGDAQARSDYNYAVARVFEAVAEAGLQPWVAPVSCPGASQTWNLQMHNDPRPERNLSIFRLVPADRYAFKGRLVVQDCDKDGIGAPLVAVTKEDIDATKIDPFAQGKHIYYGVTGLADVHGRDCTLRYEDPLSVETTTVASQQMPLAANFTAPIALALAELKPRKKELGGLFKPDNFATGPRLARLQPYDPKKIPILCIHGLGDSHATWAPLIETLRADPVVRANYQIWFYSYASGYPYPYSAALLRHRMDEITARYPDHKTFVVIGHSMGGMISRVLLTDSGMTLWNAVYDKPPEEMAFSDETRKVMTDSLIFKHRDDISRVIFMSPSHRGANMATSLFGRLGSKLIGGPKNILKGDVSALSLAKPTSTNAQLKKMPNSIDFLNPDNRFVKTLDTLPVATGIPYHTVIGDRGKGGNLNHTEPVSSDGIVPYWSSHLDGAQSELIIPSGHWSNQHPQGIAEVQRILHLHLAGAQ